MRVLHTADFHAGRNLRGLDRTPEVRAALDEIVGMAVSERADAVLVAGDLFDTVNPSAEAEEAVYSFFLRLRELGMPSVVIAGNHDSANRLAGLAPLLTHVGAHLVAQVSPRPEDMLREVTAKDGTTLKVGALPYLSERRLIKAADLLGGELGQWRQRYRDGMGFFLKQLANGFSAGSVNMLMLHATMEGSAPSGSERTFTFDITNSYTLSAQQLPSSAQYVALGHIHKPQQASEAPLAHYPGSVIQLDFGEAGEPKGVNLVEVEPGRIARVHRLPLSAGLPLKVVRAGLDDLDARLQAVADFPGRIKVVVRVPGGAALPGLKDRVLRALPGVLAVEVEAGEGGETQAAAAREGLTLEQLFERYHRERRGELSPALRAAFRVADREAMADEVEA